MFRGRSPGSKDKIRVGKRSMGTHTDSRVTSKDYSFFFFVENMLKMNFILGTKCLSRNYSWLLLTARSITILRTVSHKQYLFCVCIP